MKHSEDFEKLFIGGYQLVTVNVLYYMPDHSHLLNEFLWQTLDLRPRYPRVHKFLDYWRREIDAVIKEVVISDMPVSSSTTRWRNGIIIPIQ
jgi:uncharacterized protein Usg